MSEGAIGGCRDWRGQVGQLAQLPTLFPGGMQLHQFVYKPQKMVRRNSGLLGNCLDKPRHPDWGQGSAGGQREHGLYQGF